MLYPHCSLEAKYGAEDGISGLGVMRQGQSNPRGDDPNGCLVGYDFETVSVTAWIPRRGCNALPVELIGARLVTC
jgi:hypothetical protein